MSAGSQAPNVEYFPKVSTPPPAPKGSLGLYFDLNGILTSIDDTGHTTSAGGGATPGGADTDIQFNDGGDFGGNAHFTFDKATGNLTWDPTTAGSLGKLSNPGTGSSILLQSGDTGQAAIRVSDAANADSGGNIIIQTGEPAPGGGGIFLITENISGTGAGISLEDSDAAGGTGIAIVSDSNNVEISANLGSVNIFGGNGGQVLLAGDGSTPSPIVLGQTGDKILFFNTGSAPAPAAQQTVTGIKVDAVAASILAALKAYGLVIDATT
jgi:hypothetical protein